MNFNFLYLHTGKHPWIGLNEKNRTGDWIWASDNSPLIYSGWGVGEPNNWNGVAEDCVNIRTDHGAPFWSDAPCSFRNYFICEFNWQMLMSK